jgi:hypothetical protein
VLGLSRAAMASGAPFKPGYQIIIKIANMQVTGHRSYGYIAISALVFQHFCQSPVAAASSCESPGRSEAGSRLRTPILRYSNPSATTASPRL